MSNLDPVLESAILHVPAGAGQLKHCAGSVAAASSNERFRLRIHSHEAMKLSARGIAKQWSARFFLMSNAGLGHDGQSQEKEVNVCCI